MTNPTFLCPINLNMDGSFSITHSDRTVSTGDINADVRLAALADFLSVVDDALKENPEMIESFGQLVAKQATATGKSTITVSMVLDPETQRATFTFTAK